MTKVFVPNKSSHDFSEAEKVGELVFLSNGRVRRFHTNQMYRLFKPKLENSTPNDYILLTGLTTMACVACAIFASKHDKLNLLLFKNGRYIKRNLNLKENINES